MHEISSGPCEEISRRNAMPLPAPIASPAMTPSSSPLKHSAQTVSAPYVIPPTNASSVTWMLLNMTWNENADAVSASKSRPSTGGSAADWNSAGIRPAAAGASTSPQTAPSIAGTSSSAHAANSSAGRSASRRQ